MSWFWTILFLTFAFSSNCTEAKHHKKPSSAVVVGTVFCNTCFQQNIPKAIHFIQGASVAVECKDKSSNPSFKQQVKTDIHGEFKVKLPFPVSKHVKKIKTCTVKLISSNKPYCSIAASATTSSTLHQKSRTQKTHIYSAGFFTFKPFNQPAVCDQKPSIHTNQNKISPISNPNDPAFLPPIQDPPATGSLLPPLPELPQLPPLPQIPFLPPKMLKTELSDNNRVNLPESFPFPFNPPSIFPPNPFQPPPSVIPPIFPNPPPSIFPPIFPTPPSPPFFQLPPVPGLTPSPPPPPPPVFPFPLPPFPGFPGPGVPPAEMKP
ncbi:pollen Ole e 1 allergen and extensin [Striga asiatica]|uniref:Pollen Ole e 1 allergen and extensin n=1 Tax=Striga asiatica TaxID=4170 RepID=A0A5A7PDP3_STRAF|nr:pollen Ole e 1 allergen and extensin [Striga asiatica]